MSFRKERRIRRLAQKQSGYGRVQGTGGRLFGTHETAAVVRWGVGGEDLEVETDHARRLVPTCAQWQPPYIYRQIILCEI